MFRSMSKIVRQLSALLGLVPIRPSRRPSRRHVFRPCLEQLEDRCTPSTIKFAVIGDYGSGSSAEASVAGQVRSWNPDFIITTGDNNYGSGSADTIDAHIGQFYHDYIGNYTGSFGAGSATNRFFPSLGNHDWGTPGAQPYLDYFTLPGNERYYDFTHGPVEFFVVDSDGNEPDGTSSTSVQAQWLQKELADSTAVWKLVYFHHAAYSSGSHGSTTEMQWPFQQWGASAVLSGHDHIYERLIENNLPYFVNGLGGSSKYSIGTPVAGSQVRYNADYGAMLVNADDTQLSFQFITQAGTVIDRYTINAANASPTITSAAARTSASVGSVYSYQFTAVGTPAPTLSASGLPGWLTFDASTGLLTGTPTGSAAGTSATITLTASNGLPPDAVMTFTLNVVAGSSFVITNQTGQPVNFAMYGIDNSTRQWSFFSGMASGNNFSGTLVSAQQLGAGQLLPTYSFAGSSALLNLPNTSAGITSAAIVLTVGNLAPSITVASDFTLPRPAPSNPTLVNATTNPYYDFIEFTLDSNHTLFINTTQVDQFGFPITLGSSPQAAGAPVGVTPGITRAAIFQAFATFLTQETDPAARDFLPLIQTASTGSAYRIIAPGQYLAMPGKASDPLNHYFDPALASFFAAPPLLKLTALNPFSNGDPASYTFIGTATVHNPVASGDLVNGAPDTNPGDNHNFAVIDFVGQPGSGSLTGAHFYVYSPINAPSWVGALSAGEQVFANNGVFSDNVPRFGTGLNSIILGNLENQVVSALTRGVASIATPSAYATTTAFWTDHAQAFPEGEKANLYAKFLHTGTIGGASIFIGGRVYAFPYSDQGDQAAFFAIHDPNSISITLGPWSSTSANPTITSGAAATSAAVGSLYQYRFTASGTPTPILSASGLPGWLTFNPATGLLSGTPTLSQAGTSATVTLTASNGVAPDAGMTFTIAVPAPTTTLASTLYLRGAGTLAAQPGTTAQADTIASAGGTNHDGAPTNALVYQINGLTAAFDPTKQTQFTLFLDAGTQVANGTQVRVSYDFTGDGTYDRVETYRYFAEDNRPGWEAYTQGVGLRSATGAFVNLSNGRVKVEVWNAIGQAPVLLRVNASASDGLQSRIAIPFTAPTPSLVPTLMSLSASSAPAGSAGTAITLTGTNFNSTSTVLWNGTPLATTRLNATQLTVIIPAANLALPGVASIAVNNPAPGGGTSAALPFTITAAAPALLVNPTALALGTTTAGTAGAVQTFTVSGGNLTGNMVLNAPTGVQLSSDGVTYGSSLNLVPNATGTVASTTLRVRISASAPAGAISGNIAVSSAGATQQNVAVTGTITAAPLTTPIGNTLYLLSAGTPGSAGTLSAQPGTGAQVDTIASAGGKNYDGTPTNALVYRINGLTGSYNPAQHTQFTLFVDAGTQVANGTQLRISYDFNGDGVSDRVETYRYFAEDNRTGWETYTQAVGLRGASGSFANFSNGTIQVEIWNAIGKAPVSLRTNATSSNGQLSSMLIPFANLTQATVANVVPTLTSTWKYLDNGTDQGTSWRGVGFDDTAWKSGAAQLGYGDGDEKTVIGYGPDTTHKYVTTYFRQTFSVTDPTAVTALNLNLLRDDGAVVYLNGTEVFRSNMPTGIITAQTFASTAIAGTEESTWYPATISPTLLRAGANILAVEVHQANATSSDVSFDLGFVGSPTSEPSQWTLVWSDEFNDYQGTPDPSKWSFDIGTGADQGLVGWGNNELQYYTARPENIRVEDGSLIITALKEDYGGMRYTSARIVSRETGDWQYGKVEVRAKLPEGDGTWSAIWMLPTEWRYGGWPNSGELDIMEQVGFDPGTIYGTVHTAAFNHLLGTQQGGSTHAIDVVNEFHTYAIEWSPTAIDFIVDGVNYFSFDNTGNGYQEWPFDQSFHLLMNVAVGGNWGALHGVDDLIWPQQMEIDYVRVFQEV